MIITLLRVFLRFHYLKEGIRGQLRPFADNLDRLEFYVFFLITLKHCITVYCVTIDDYDIYGNVLPSDVRH